MSSCVRAGGARARTRCCGGGYDTTCEGDIGCGRDVREGDSLGCGCGDWHCGLIRGVEYAIITYQHLSPFIFYTGIGGREREEGEDVLIKNMHNPVANNNIRNSNLRTINKNLIIHRLNIKSLPRQARKTLIRQPRRQQA